MAECLKSLMPQLLEEDELIIIDDCSHDKTTETAERLLSSCQITNTLIISNHLNKGPSYSRNQGLLKATKDWVIFVDGDDTLSSDLFLELRKAVDRHQECDYFVAGFQTIISSEAGYSAKNRTRHVKTGCPMETVNILRRYIPEYLQVPYDRWDFTHCWGRLYRRKILEEQDITFDEETDQAEDIMFNLDYLPFCSYVYFLNRGYYQQYVDSTRSLSAQLGSEPDYLKKMSRIATRIFTRSIPFCHFHNLKTKKIIMRKFVGEFLSLGIYRTFFSITVGYDITRFNKIMNSPQQKYFKYVRFHRKNSLIFFMLLRFNLLKFYIFLRSIYYRKNYKNW